MNLELYPLRFRFLAQDPIFFPAGKSSNILRGAFGTILRRLACDPECRDARLCEVRAQCAYALIFEPASLWEHASRRGGPGGLADWPRPFVFRASHLDGSTIAPGEEFHFDLNVFELHAPALEYFVRTFLQLAREGIGPRRGCAHLASVWQLDASGAQAAEVYDGSELPMRTPGPPLSIPLEQSGEAVNAIQVEFATPTELKSRRELAARPEFPVLFGRVRDRVGALRTLYGPGPLDIDFKALAERARAVRMTRCDLHKVKASRLSTRTGQVHSLGGFVGTAAYEGELAVFLPFLKAACWTGVGRQTVWGKGEIRITGISTAPDGR